MLTFDHIVITAPSVDEGVAYVRDLTGIDMPKGGEHPDMGTHNHLIRLGADQFLEVIAVNPDAPAPARPRWFGLDHPVQSPRLAHWVVRCANIDTARPLLPDDHGPAIPLTRGHLSWFLTVPEDGHLPMQGAAPSLLQWATAPLPPTQMPAADATMMALTITHPQADQLHATYSHLLNDDRITFETGPLNLSARLKVGNQEVTLS